jgi:hypothetical protein
VIGTVGSIWFWEDIECPAEIVTTAAAANNSQGGYLSGKFPLTLFNEEIAKLACEHWHCLDKQWWLPRHPFNYPTEFPVGGQVSQVYRCPSWRLRR